MPPKNNKKIKKQAHGVLHLNLGSGGGRCGQLGFGGGVHACDVVGLFLFQSRQPCCPLCLFIGQTGFFGRVLPLQCGRPFPLLPLVLLVLLFLPFRRSFLRR